MRIVLHVSYNETGTVDGIKEPWVNVATFESTGVLPIDEDGVFAQAVEAAVQEHCRLTQEPGIVLGVTWSAVPWDEISQDIWERHGLRFVGAQSTSIAVVVDADDLVYETSRPSGE